MDTYTDTDGHDDFVEDTEWDDLPRTERIRAKAGQEHKVNGKSVFLHRELAARPQKGKAPR